MMEPGEMGKKAQEWLTEEGYTVQLSRKAEYSSHFTVFRPERREFAVTLAQAADSDKLTLTAGVSIGGEESARMKNASAEARNDFLKGLTSLLYSKSSVFSIDEDGGMVSGVTLSSAIYADGLTKDRLMSEMRAIFSNQMLVILQLNSFFGGLPAPSAPASRPVAAARSSAGTFCSNCGKQNEAGQKFCTKCGQKLP
jgi:hypothetical protein